MRRLTMGCGVALLALALGAPAMAAKQQSKRDKASGKGLRRNSVRVAAQKWTSGYLGDAIHANLVKRGLMTKDDRVNVVAVAGGRRLSKRPRHEIASAKINVVADIVRTSTGDPPPRRVVLPVHLADDQANLLRDAVGNPTLVLYPNAERVRALKRAKGVVVLSPKMDERD